MRSSAGIVVGLLVTAACAGDEADSDRVDASTTAEVPAAGDIRSATALASGSAELSADEIEAGRLDPSWRRYADADTTGRDRGTDMAPSPDSAESWEDISPSSVNAPPSLPIHGDVAGPSVAKIQILLDQARFSPGIIDGRWGKNTEKAVYWFQKANGIEATGRVDGRTLDAIGARARASRQVREHTLTEADVEGPFEALPDDVYERAEKPCLCYESLQEKLSEMFHSTPELLEQLNPDVDLGTVAAGQVLQVPAVEPFRLDDLPAGNYTGGGEVARLVISDGGHYVHALDPAGSILYHFPSTLGSDYAPSPSGELSLQSITFDPTWHYQPDLLTGVDPSREDAVLPAGPNNAVGVVWMQLSREHYGVHGTSAPETIGYATSHGCVRLTNWDAALLGQRVPESTPVEFRDVAEDRVGKG